MSSFVTFLLLVLFTVLTGKTVADTHDSFLQCLTQNSNNNSISNVVYTPNNSSFSSVLEFPVRNARFSLPTTPTPLVIVTPIDVSHVQTTINCARKHGMEVRTRSGGHDYEGLSYVSQQPFVILDLINYRSIDVDVENSTAWIQAGAILGELYYRIAEKSSTLAFPAGMCPTVGVGGHFSGGGQGMLMRKFGLSADQVIDAHIVDVHGRILDRSSMGEDLFWAIRGGGGASFGVIVAWKVKLVTVPSTLTVFTVDKTLEQNATKVVHKWQSVAPNIDEDLFLRVFLLAANSNQQDGNRTVQASITSLFLGRTDELLALMQEKFPELGVVKDDCIEMSWIQSILYFAGIPQNEALEILLNRSSTSSLFKAKSDYVMDPIPETGLEGLWQWYFTEEVNPVQIMLSPYGGKMEQIPESEAPIPHRAGNLFNIHYVVGWLEEDASTAQKHMNYIRGLYKYMEPYVSKSPRAAYMNYRDLDLGTNSKGNYTSYRQASKWGLKYFKSNFDRLIRVKRMVDPQNFFRNEQSIPSL